MRSFICHAESLESRRLLSNTALLDPSFGDGGIAKPNFPGVDNQAGSKAIAAAGDKIITLADVSVGDNSGFGLARLKSDGTIDTTFGNDGYVVQTYSPGMLPYDMTVDPSGRILVAGQFFDHSGAQPTDHFITVRFNPNGAIDRTFGDRGSVVTSFNDLGFSSSARAIAVGANGHIAVAGVVYVDVNSTVDSRIAVAEYTDSGALTGFSTDGRAVTDTPGVLPSIGVEAAQYQPDGKLVLAGTTREDFLVVRYNTNGTLDHSFSTDGLASADFAHGSSDAAYAMAIALDGKIILGGTTGGLGAPVAMVRFGANGSIDTSFGVGGLVTAFGTPLISRIINDIALLANGQIMVSAVAGQNVVLERFNSDGSVDTSFGDSGEAQADFSGIGPRTVNLIQQSDGKFVVGGSNHGDFAPLVARFGRDDVSVTTGGKLIIDGTSGDDIVKISRVGTKVHVIFNGVARDFANVHQISALLNEGADQLYSSVGLPTTVDGGPGNDTVVTGDGDDLIVGAAGNDRILTTGGNDTVSASGGRDFVDTGSGNDLLDGGSSGGDTLVAGAGDDRVNADGPDRVFGDDGNDTIIADRGDNTVFGGNGDDSISGSLGDGNFFNGEAGNDTITGGLGTDNITGGDGNDLLTGRDGNDTLAGNAGADVVFGGIGADVLAGNGGKDRLNGDGGRDRIFGGDGNDAIDGAAGDDRLFGQGGDDKLIGGEGNDSLDGGAGVDVFIANLGNDSIFSRDNNVETLDGGTGEDHGIIDTDDVLVSIETTDQLFS